MKVLTYNILNGGEGNRLPHIIDVLTQEHADIILLQEANGFEKASLEQLRMILGLHSCALSPGNRRRSGKQYHVATLSRYPLITEYKIHTGFHHAALKTVLETDIGRLCVINAHLSPESEDRRILETRELIRQAAGNEHAIIGGDLNALSNHDDYSTTLPNFSENLKKMFVSDNRIRTEVTKRLELEFHIDTAAFCKSRDYTIPTPLSPHHTDGLTFRVDYIFASKSLRRSIATARTIKTELTNKASDHYPYVVEFT